MSEYLTIRAGDRSYRIHKTALFERLYESAPRALTDPDSDERRQSDWLYLIPKPLIRSLIQRIVRNVFGADAPDIPRDQDMYAYSLRLLLIMVCEGATLKTWSLDIADETTDPESEARIYDVRGILADAGVTESDESATEPVSRTAGV